MRELDYAKLLSASFDSICTSDLYLWQYKEIEDFPFFISICQIGGLEIESFLSKSRKALVQYLLVGIAPWYIVILSAFLKTNFRLECHMGQEMSLE